MYEVAREVCETGQAVLETYGVSDNDALAVGLTCGGILHVFVEPVNAQSFPELGEVTAAIRAGQPVAVATVIEGPGQVGARRVIWAARTGPRQPGRRGPAGPGGGRRRPRHAGPGPDRVRRYGEHGERRGDELAVFVHSFAPPPRMLVFGAIDFAAAVARAGKFLGYRVTVCDARPIFATQARFPDADEVVVDWPHRFLAKTPWNRAP